MKDAVALEKVAADINTLMTRDAAERFEQLIAVLLFDRECGGIATEPPVKSAAGGEQ